MNTKMQQNNIFYKITNQGNLEYVFTVLFYIDYKVLTFKNSI